MGISDDPGIYDYYGYMDYVYGEKSAADIASDNDSFELFKIPRSVSKYSKISCAQKLGSKESWGQV